MAAIDNAHSARLTNKPSDNYVMGRQDWPEERRYQLQFHKSPKIIRALFLGNGSGKTSTVGIEADFWLQHTHPFKHIQQIPSWQIQVLWICQSYPQMEQLRPQLEEQCFTPGWSYRESPTHRYVWPHGGCLQLFSDDSDWKKLQGVPIDLCVIDEECDPKHWRELVMRRRGRKKTRFIIAATATQGKRWMYHDVYRPWLEHHQNLGLAVTEGHEEEAMLAQAHPTIFCWPKGGLPDNPLSAASDQDSQWYASSLLNASAAERKVRMEGGFASLNASPVFDGANLEVMSRLAAPFTSAGVSGFFRPLPRAKRRGPNDSLAVELEFVGNGGKFGNGTITIYEHPDVDDPDDHYVIGADFGAGLENRDWDAACVLSQRRRRQVAQARGRWGDIQFAQVLWWLGWYFNEALLIGERQFGLPTMRRLHDEWGYTYQYMQSDEKHVNTRKSDLLGHHRYHGDLIIPNLQWAIAPMTMDKLGRPTGEKGKPVVQFVDKMLLSELEDYEYHPRSQAVDLADAGGLQMITGAPAGGFDDCVMSAAYAVTGWIELPKYLHKRPIIRPGTLGDRLGHAKIMEESLHPEQVRAKVFKHAKGGKQERKLTGPAWPPPGW